MFLDRSARFDCTSTMEELEDLAHAPLTDRRRRSGTNARSSSGLLGTSNLGRMGRWEKEEAGPVASVESSPDDSPWEMATALAGPGSAGAPPSSPLAARVPEVVAGVEGRAALSLATRALDSAAAFGEEGEGEEGQTLPATRADGIAAVDGRAALSAAVFRRPFRGEDAAGAHLLRGGPVNESLNGGECGPSATPQNAVAARDADLSQEVDRGAGRRDGRALLEEGLLGNKDLLSLVQVGVATPSKNKNVKGAGRSSFQCRVAPQTSIRHNALAEMKSNSGSAGTRPRPSPGWRHCAAQPSG